MPDLNELGRMVPIPVLAIILWGVILPALRRRFLNDAPDARSCGRCGGLIPRASGAKFRSACGTPVKP